MPRTTLWQPMADSEDFRRASKFLYLSEITRLLTSSSELTSCIWHMSSNMFYPAFQLGKTPRSVLEIEAVTALLSAAACIYHYTQSPRLWPPLLAACGLCSLEGIPFILVYSL